MVKIVGRGIDLPTVAPTANPSSGYERLSDNAAHTVELRTSAGIIYPQRIKPRGIWSSAAAYDVGDVVEWQKYLYICILTRSATGTQPASDTSHWTQLYANPVIPLSVGMSAPYLFNSSVGPGYTAFGDIRFNNATQNLTTLISIARYSGSSQDTRSTWAALITELPGIFKGYLRITGKNNIANHLFFRVTGIAQPATDGDERTDLTVIYIAGSAASPFTSADEVTVDFVPNRNPMTTADDIIVGGASGLPTRVAKGANNRVFGVDASGVLGYKQVGNDDIAADAVTALVGSTLSGTTTSTTLVVPTGGTITFTSRGGSFWMIATGSVFVSAASQIIFGYSLDNASNAGALLVGTITIVNINSNYPWACMYPTGAVAAGSHTHRFWWQTSAGTMTMNNGIFSIFERSR